MIHQNVQFFNVEELIPQEDGSITWLRIPKGVCDTLEKKNGPGMAQGSTGVELRFVLKGEKAVIRMCVTEEEGTFHVYRGGVQGGWEDHEVNKLVDQTPRDYVIKRSKNLPGLKAIHEAGGLDWDPEVIRVIFDRGTFKIFDIQGDVEPPKLPQRPCSVTARPLPTVPIPLIHPTPGWRCWLTT